MVHLEGSGNFRWDLIIGSRSLGLGIEPWRSLVCGPSWYRSLLSAYGELKVLLGTHSLWHNVLLKCIRLTTWIDLSKTMSQEAFLLQIGSVGYSVTVVHKYIQVDRQKERWRHWWNDWREIVTGRKASSECSCTLHGHLSSPPYDGKLALLLSFPVHLLPELFVLSQAHGQHVEPRKVLSTSCLLHPLCSLNSEEETQYPANTRKCSADADYSLN